jgi:hypothetical protein
MREPYLPVVVLEEADLHPEQIQRVYLLQVEAYLVAGAQAVQLRVADHQAVLVFQGLTCAKLAVVEFYLPIISVLDEDGRRGDSLIVLCLAVIILRAWVEVLGRLRVLICQLLVARRIERECEWLPEATEGIDLKCGLNEIYGLPVLMPRGLLEFVDKI